MTATQAEPNAHTSTALPMRVEGTTSAGRAMSDEKKTVSKLATGSGKAGVAGDRVNGRSSRGCSCAWGRQLFALRVNEMTGEQMQ